MFINLLQTKAVMDKSKPRVVVITGASSGIGREAARLFFQEGNALVLAARRAERLEELALELDPDKERVMVVPTDLFDPDQARKLADLALERFGQVDVLVNNAGYGLQARFDSMSQADVSAMFAVNVLSPVALCQALVPAMMRKGVGAIVNVASVGGVVPHPFNVIYCATKHAIVGFSRSLRLELYGTGVSVCCVCPAATRTEFFDKALKDIPFPSAFASMQLSPKKVAQVIVAESKKNRSLVFPSWSARFLYWLEKIAPPLSQWANLAYRNKVKRS